jgi:hypothetical protein
LRRVHVLPVAIVCALVLVGCGSSGKPSASAATEKPTLRFAQCMRAHGVSDFPDPTAGGGLQIGGSGINPKSPAFQSAQRSCRKLLPSGGPPTHMSAGELRRAFAFARCMRANGVPSFPDPTQGAAPSNRESVLVLQGMFFEISPGTDLESPAFRGAAQRCGVKLPTGPPHSVD